MKHEIAFWGCMVCSQTWVSAPGDETLDLVMAEVWLIFGLLIYALRNARFMRHSGDVGRE